MSEETKWTKGPWRRSPSNESGGSFIEHIDADYVSHLVAFVHASHGMFDEPVPTEEDAANARLIAAAPELYDALEWAMRFVEQVRAESPAPKGCGEDISYRYARTALSKARGES